MDLAAQRLSKTDMIYADIKKSIMGNEFSSDTPLTEVSLCNKYGYSRTPVREALQRLQNEGFINFIKGKGFFLSQIGLDDVLQIYEMREALEGMAARLCAMRVTDSIVEELDGYLKKGTACFKEGNSAQAMEHDMMFHRCILSASQNERIEKTVNSLIELSSQIVLKADTNITRQSLDDHHKLLQAIRNSDSDLAESLMREHISNAKKYHFNKYYRGSQ